MGLTKDQLKKVWAAQQRANFIRYRFLNTNDKAAFDAEQELVYAELEPYLIQRYGSDVGDYGATEDFTDTGKDPVYPFATTTTVGNITTDTQLEKHVVKVNEKYWNLNLLLVMDANDITKNTLEEVWNFIADPHNPDIPVISTTAPLKTIPNDIIYKRFSHDENTHNPAEPDMFARNHWFKVENSDGTISWVNKYDPTQQYIWSNIVKQNGDALSGILSVSNRLPLDQGLDQGAYDPSHPENIDEGWSLVSHSGNMWLWAFSYSDDTYRLQITQQVDNSYKHAVLFKQMSIEEWVTKYVGDNY